MAGENRRSIPQGRSLLSRYYRWSEGIRHATMRYVLGAYFLFIELYVFPFAGNLTVARSRVRRGGRNVTL